MKPTRWCTDFCVRYCIYTYIFIFIYTYATHIYSVILHAAINCIWNWRIIFKEIWNTQLNLNWETENRKNKNNKSLKCDPPSQGRLQRNEAWKLVWRKFGGRYTKATTKAAIKFKNNKIKNKIQQQQTTRKAIATNHQQSNETERQPSHRKYTNK